MSQKENSHKKRAKVSRAGAPSWVPKQTDAKWKSDKSQIIQIREAIKISKKKRRKLTESKEPRLEHTVH